MAFLAGSDGRFGPVIARNSGKPTGFESRPSRTFVTRVGIFVTGVENIEVCSAVYGTCIMVIRKEEGLILSR